MIPTFSFTGNLLCARRFWHCRWTFGWAPREAEVKKSITPALEEQNLRGVRLALTVEIDWTEVSQEDALVLISQEAGWQRILESGYLASKPSSTDFLAVGPWANPLSLCGSVSQSGKWGWKGHSPHKCVARTKGNAAWTRLG